ncbi:MAG TPA: homoserine dehydrogenase [Candidatus Lustribacter sp.]|nr:homoserine dehydrogenase [Candidatus Lustribacter sp.]
MVTENRARQEPLRVALLGCGVVGSAVARLLTEHAEDLAARIGRPVQIVGIAVRRPGRDRSDTGVDASLFTTDAADLVTRADIVIEVIGGIEPARSLILAAMARGASVVTANKALLAEDGPTLYDAAERYGVDLYYEAAVAGAIPLLRPLRESLAGDAVRTVLGIVNGTTNYVLDKMDTTGAGFTEAVEQAQALGYAEADPTADVEGFDAAGQLMFYGRGAGGDPTASAVLGDLVAVARHKVTGGRGPGESTYADLPVMTMGQAYTRYHISLDVADRPGVLAQVATAFADNNVSIETVRQRAALGGGGAELVIVTHRAPDAALSATVDALAGLPVVAGVTSVMRVEGS